MADTPSSPPPCAPPPATAAAAAAAAADPRPEVPDPLAANPPARSLAADDLWRSLTHWELWGRLGWQDILQRYRRSVIGPFWITASMGVLVATLGLLYATLFQVDVPSYLPFLALGFIIWTFVNAAFNEGAQVFILAEGYIKQMDTPLSLHVMRAIWRNLIVLAHNMLVFLVVALLYPQPWGWGLLTLIPALILLVANAVWIMIVLGLAGARFRDIPPIVASLLQLVFFVTPIIWKPELLEGRALFLNANPVFHLVDLVRAPLLGETASALSWVVVLAITVGGWRLTWWALNRFGPRLAYWL